MILDDRTGGRPRGSDVVDVNELLDHDLVDATLLGADRFALLRAAGLPVRSDRPPAMASRAVERLLVDVEVSAGAMALLRDPLAESTERGYLGDWAYFDRWCHTRGYGDAAAADELVVLEFIAAHVEQGLSISPERRFGARNRVRAARRSVRRAQNPK